MEVLDWFMNATVMQILARLAGIVAALSVVVEFTPIKVNPISALLNWIGERTNRGLNDRINELEEKIGEVEDSQKSIEKDFERRNAINCRVRILRFSDELRRKIRHSQESFEQVLDDLDVYEKYCDANPDFKNNKTIMAKERIKAAYDGCMEQNDFL